MVFKSILLYLLGLSAIVFSQDTITIRGRVLDYSEVPAAGLRVMSAMRSDSTVTDAEGRFDIQVSRQVVGVQSSVPTSFALSMLYPNPGVSHTSLSLALPHPAQVSAHIYNVLGQHIRTLTPRYLDVGHHTLHWDLRDDQAQPVARGLYLMRISVNDRLIQRKVAVVPGGNAAISPLFVPLAKPCAELALLISDPGNRYHEHIEYIEVNGASLIDDIQISVNRKAELRFAGADTISAIVGHVDSVMVYMDDDEPISRNSIEITTKFNHLALDHTLFEDSIRVRFTPTSTGPDGIDRIIISLINNSGEGATTQIPVNIEYRLQLARLLPKGNPPAEGVTLYGPNGRPINATETDGAYRFTTGEDTVLIGDNTDALRVIYPLSRAAAGLDSVVYVAHPDLLPWWGDLMTVLNAENERFDKDREKFARVIHWHPDLFRVENGVRYLRSTLVHNIQDEHFEQQKAFYQTINGWHQEWGVTQNGAPMGIEMAELIDNQLEEKEQENLLYLELLDNLEGHLFFVYNNFSPAIMNMQYSNLWDIEQIPGYRTYGHGAATAGHPWGTKNAEFWTPIYGAGEVHKPPYRGSAVGGGGSFDHPIYLYQVDGQVYAVAEAVAKLLALPHAALLVHPERDGYGNAAVALPDAPTQEALQMTLDQAKAYALRQDRATQALHRLDELVKGTLPQEEFEEYRKEFEQMGFERYLTR